MKKFLASALLCFTVFLFTSCTSPMTPSGNRQNNLNCPFSAAMTISLDKLTAEGTITRSGDGQWKAEFESPNTLSGVTLAFDGNIVNASYKGLSFSVPKAALPVKAMLMNLIEAVDTAAREEELKGTENEGMLEITGSLEGGEYTLTVDGNGYISSFEMPNNLLKISFSDVRAAEASSEPRSTASSEAESQTETSTTVTTSAE